MNLNTLLLFYDSFRLLLELELPPLSFMYNALFLSIDVTALGFLVFFDFYYGLIFLS